MSQLENVYRGKGRMSRQRPLRRRSFLKRVSALGAAGVVAPWHLAATAGTAGVAGRRAPGLGELTVADFRAALGTRTLLEHEPGRVVAAKLIEARALAAPGRITPRQPFSVIFRVPGQLRLAQGTYRLKNARLGTLKLFLVPVDPPGNWRHLEAVFG